MLEELLSALIPQGKKVLDTKKIDKNIKTLLEYKWFEDLYGDENYRHLFFSNRKIRSYLESDKRVTKLIASSINQEKFIGLLNDQIRQ